MRTIELKEEEINTNLNYVALLQYYQTESKRINMSFSIIKNQYSQYTDSLYDTYEIDKDKETIRFTPDGKSLEVFKKDDVEEKE